MNNSRASHYRHLLLHSPLLILLFGLWIQLSALYDKQHQIHNIAMQAAGSSSTTHTAIAANTQITITDKDKQTQDTDTISRDTEHASYTMTQINTEVLDIRKGLSEDLSKDGFKAVGDLAMKEGWEDGSVEKTLAHAAMGAVVAAVGNGDALGGALGAGAAEMARPATADADKGTQQSVSALVGALAGGGTGASVGLDGEKYNRQLHQREIAWIEQNAAKYAALHDGMTPEQAKEILAKQGMRNTDTLWSGMYDENKDAQAFMEQNSDGTLFQATQAEKDNFMQNIGTFYKNDEFYKNVKKDATLLGITVGTTNAVMQTNAEALMKLHNASPQEVQEALNGMGNAAIRSLQNGDTEMTDEYLRALSQGYKRTGELEKAAKVDSLRAIRSAPELATALAGGLIGGKVLKGIKFKGTTKYTEPLGTKGINKGLHERINGKKPKANLPNGYKYNKDGNVITPEGQTLTKGTFTTPSGRTYDHYGREIDMDLKFEVKNHKTGVVKEYTNREWMSKNNNNPYVLDSNGKPVPINRHHNGKKASGPILDIEQPIHQRDTKNLHPYGNNPHPRDPVNRDEWRTDNKDINKQLLEQNKKGEN